jgi:8-oxo-dGTP pyrophosphatase MutT (NUDIX family)
MEPNTHWKVLSSHYLIQSRHLRLRCDTVELPSGYRITDYYVRESFGFAIIFALTPNKEVVLVRQYKHGIAQSVLELPAGMIEPNESSDACAERELAEETGYTGDRRYVTSFISDPTGSSGRFHLFHVSNAQATLQQNLDPGEEIAVELTSLPDLRRLLREGVINVGSSVAAIYFMLDYLEML